MLPRSRDSRHGGRRGRARIFLPGVGKLYIAVLQSKRGSVRVHSSALWEEEKKRKGGRKHAFRRLRGAVFNADDIFIRARPTWLSPRAKTERYVKRLHLFPIACDLVISSRRSHRQETVEKGKSRRCLTSKIAGERTRRERLPGCWGSSMSATAGNRASLACWHIKLFTGTRLEDYFEKFLDELFSM